MKQICDLHTHSVFSDGTYTPTQIIEEAERIGLSAVALCDHNTIDGVPEFMSAAESKNVEAVAGVEFSTDCDGKELHILALYIQPREFDKITEFVAEMRRAKEESNAALIESLRKAGFDIDYKSVCARTPTGGFNRSHVAAELTEKGYTASVKEAFDTVLHPSAGHYSESKRLNALETVEFIRSMNAVPILAHPFLNLSYEELKKFLNAAVPLGLAGMETHYSTYDDDMTEKAISVAAEFGIAQSGGSDFHGDIKPGIKLGEGCGNLAVPLEFAQKIKGFVKG